MGMILNWVYGTKQELNNPDQVRVDCIVVEADFLSSGLHNIYSLLSKELGSLCSRQLLQFVIFVLRGIYDIILMVDRRRFNLTFLFRIVQKCYDFTNFIHCSNFYDVGKYFLLKI